MKFVLYKNGLIVENKLCNDFSAMELTQFNEIKDKKYIKTKFDDLFLNWNFAFNLYNKSIKESLNSPVINLKFIKYQLNIIFNSFMELIDKMRKLFQVTFPKITKEDKAEGYWLHKEITKDLYDNNFSYRLIYNLRNYLQHVDIVGIDVCCEQDGNKIILTIARYIENHTGIQEKFKTELLSLLEKKLTINLDNIINEMDNLAKQFENKSEIKLKEIMLQNDMIYNLSIAYLIYKRKNLPENFNAIIDSNEQKHNINGKLYFVNIQKIIDDINANCYVEFRENLDFTNYLNKEWEHNHLDIKYEIIVENNNYLLKVPRVFFNNEKAAVINAINDFIKIFKF